MSDPAALLSSIGAQLDHVAHAVPSIRPLVPLYRDLLGGTPTLGGVNHAAGHAVVQFTYPGGGKVELLEPVRADSPSIGAFLERNPRGGLHHITFHVPDLASALEKIRAGGFNPFGVSLESPVWKELFLHPRETHGVLIQVAQKSAGSSPVLDRPVEDLLDEVEAMRAAG